MAAWVRGPWGIASAIAVLGAGVWWGVVRPAGDNDTERSSAERTPSELASDPTAALELVPGCRPDVCRVVAHRRGFEHRGEPATLLVVATEEECDGRPRIGLHLAGRSAVIWSGPETGLCGVPTSGIQRDGTGHAFLVVPGTDGMRRAVVLRFERRHVEDFGSLDGRFEARRVEIVDLDGDGIVELVLASGCHDCPDDGSAVAYRWTGRDYTVR